MSDYNDDENVNEANVMKIMVATDIHLGYSEKDTVRGDDSFIAFEEVLELATANEVDFILLGGDLFHDATPTPNSLQKCIKLLRRYTLGDSPIAIEFLSDQSVNFADALNQTVNYEDPNINISIPVFSIHGNHDDPSGFGRLSSLDIISTSGLVNYFGKWLDLTQITINPILLKKGETQLALYGLSYIQDARLVRLFNESKVTMEKPNAETGEWFNILVLHQNRADRGLKNYIPERILPEFLDLVVWGHEHDCRINPEENCERKFFVTQPGSSVATSLAEGESLPKHCGLLTIYKTKFQLEPIPLKTVRPFVFKSINLADMAEEYSLDEGDIEKKVVKIASELIDSMILNAKEKLSGDPRQPKLPLIRLRIVYNEERQMFNAVRFCQQYSGKVANTTDMILFKRAARKVKGDVRPFDKEAMDGIFEEGTKEQDIKVEDIVEQYFEEIDDSKKLQIISSKTLSELCRRLVDSNDVDAATCLVNFYKEKASEFLCEHMPAEDEIEEKLSSFRLNWDQTHADALAMLDKRGQKYASAQKATNSDQDDTDVEMDNDDDQTLKNAIPMRGGRKKTPEKATRGASKRGRGRGSRGGKVAGTTKAELSISTSSPRNPIRQMFSRNKNAVTYEISDDSD